ncbi:diaminopimelate epimerase [Bacillus sp. FJAT-42376]|uniref:diaminopimelate epimerase n=1 Tax=Bacillus sp. FJAT-42376 TaxID=2014076 RepID=UPI000F515B3E|nr:diaminopimelate epimerase [Bacillus sp. FJAT-42376]AZB44275.1 diaminopimelate epimerase [Bacillus sp. FJAT-42376]
MNTFKFTKMHGLGNNYIYVNMFEESLKEGELPRIAKEVANPFTGIGSDGMILICPSEKAPVKMRIFNNDGSEALNCGNGLRCVAKYAYEHQLVKDPVFKIETLSGLVEAKVQVENNTVQAVTIDMGEPRLFKKDIPMDGNPGQTTIAEQMEFQGTEYEITALSMGNPHIIFYIEDIEKAPLTTLGPIVEKDPRFHDGINVEFIEVLTEKELNFRVWERGSGITQACGTGACAAAVASVLNGKSPRGEDITVHLAGGDLIINWTEHGSVLMTGPAEVIAEGTYYIR